MEFDKEILKQLAACDIKEKDIRKRELIKQSMEIKVSIMKAKKTKKKELAPTKIIKTRKTPL